jgi:uncharacterized protein YebE (UPF0316 family)
VWSFAVIFVAQAVYVTIMTVRWIILVRGGRWLASFISFFELVLYVYALGLVVTELSNPWKVVTYALGYACGSLAGSYIEEKLAIGYSLYQVISAHHGKLAPVLRQNGFGVTVWKGEGRQGEREVLSVVASRKAGGRLVALIESVDAQAFIVRLESNWNKGGFLQKYIR